MEFSNVNHGLSWNKVNNTVEYQSNPDLTQTNNHHDNRHHKLADDDTQFEDIPIGSSLKKTTYDTINQKSPICM